MFVSNLHMLALIWIETHFWPIVLESQDLSVRLCNQIMCEWSSIEWYRQHLGLYYIEWMKVNH